MGPAPHKAGFAGSVVGGESTRWRTIPNFLTAVRLILTIPFAYFVLRGQDMAALAIFVIAGLTDSLDGYIAKHFNQYSLMGRIADPIADKVLTCTAFVTLAFFRHGRAIPHWLALSALSRDALILAGCLVLYAATRSAAFRPTELGKLNTFGEIVVIVSFLLSTRYPAISSILSSLYILLAILLIASIADYTLEGFALYRASRPSAPDDAARLDDVLAEELRLINHSRTQRDLPQLDQVPFNTTGLALSGGGIRAATFHLGFLQSLARCGVLSTFDYVSAVSGGSYIATWLGGLMRDRTFQEVLTILNPSPTATESPEVTHLRDYSNYLTPRLGLFSPHVWTFIATYLRNLFVTSVLILLPVIALLLLPRLFGVYILVALLGGPSFIACQVVLVAVTALNITRAIRQFLTDRGRPAVDRGIYYSRICFAWLLACVCLTGLVVRYHRDLRNIVAILRGHDHSSPLVSALRFVVNILGSPDHPEDVWRRPLNSWQTVLVIVSVAFLLVLLPLFLQKNLEQWVRTSELRVQRILIAVGAFVLFGVFVNNRLWIIHHWVDLRLDMMDHATIVILAATWVLPGLLIVSVLVLAPIDAMMASILLQLKRPTRHKRNRRDRGGCCARLWLRWIELDLLEEHLSRTYGTILIYAVSMTAVSATAIYGPFVVMRALDNGSWPAVVSIWAVGTALGLFVVFWPRMKQAENEFIAFWVGRLLPYWFASVPIVATAWLVHGLMMGFRTGDWAWYASITRLTFSLRVVYYLLFVALFGHALASCAGVNRYSMHSFYRTRLVQCYLLPRLIRRGSHGRRLGEDLALSGLKRACENGGPLLLFNAAFNVSSRSRLAWQERRAVSFAMSPLFCGYSGTVANPGGGLERIEAFRSTHEYKVENVNITCGFAMATSGAAISPTLIFQGTPRFNVLMSLLNLRLGVWVPNPHHPVSWRREMPRSLIHFLLREFAGQMDHRGSFVYLSDGGHFENLGIYELVRRRCRAIVVSDCGEDFGSVLKGVAVAIERCRVDFGVEVDIDLGGVKGGSGQSHVAVGKILYPDGASGTLLYCRANLTGDEPLDIQSYAMRHPAYPNQSTANQWFGETQFEAYRKLGEHVGDAAACRLPAETMASP